MESIAQLGFVLLWACVMPFICWGAWAQPGHSHPSPHPFFSSAVPSVEHIGHTAATPDQAKDEQPAGASRPDTLLASLFLLGLLLRQSWLPRLQAERRYTRRRTLHTRQAWLPVPTPPPRQV